MTVDELRAILDHLPGDLPVAVHANPGPAHHVTSARRSNVRGHPSKLILEGRNAVITEPDPGFELTGRYRRPDELLLRLDPEVPLGVPA